MFSGEEKRAYSRDDHFYKEAHVSRDSGKSWHEIVMSDLSAGGFRFELEKDNANHIFEVDELLMFKTFITTVEGFVSDDPVRFQAKIKWRKQTGKYFDYGVRFYNLPKDVVIRIDEVVAHNKRFANMSFGEDKHE